VAWLLAGARAMNQMVSVAEHSMDRENSPRRRAAGRIPPAIAIGVLSVALAVAVVAAIGTGAFPISPTQAIAILLRPVLDLGVEYSAQQDTVLHAIRLPRVLLGVLTGAGLALAGAGMQGLFRNPLADPGLVGVSGGAALAAATVIVMGALWVPGLSRTLGLFTLPLAAFLGGLVVTVLVYQLAGLGGRTSLAVMLLAGIAVNALVGAGIGMFTYIASDEQLRNLTFWSLGSLAGANWKMLAVIAPCVIAAAALLLRLAKPLNALALGEREAGHLGVSVERLKFAVIAAAALIVGALVAVTGMIGFIGLVAPHMVRLACGPDHRVLLPAAALLGGILIVLADLAARTVVAPAELPIGVLTALLGAPFFLALLVKDRRRLTI